MKRAILKEVVFVFLCLYGFCGITFSQEECGIQLNADVRHCTCLNNGEIIFKLTKSVDCNLDTTNTRYSLYSPANSISSENSISPVFNNLPPGDYMGIVKVVHQTGALGSGAIVVISDTIQLTLNTSYTAPTMGILENEYNINTPFGKVRSLPCIPTGIVQLHIHGGAFPYIVNVYRYDGSDYQFFREFTFDTIQHTGTNASKMNYFEYYNIDSLPAGKYRFILTDGCGYSPQKMETSLLETPALNEITNTNMRVGNWDQNSGNSIAVQEMVWPYVLNYFAIHMDYYAERQNQGIENYWEYRWVDPSVNGGIPDTSAWQPIIFTSLTHNIAAATKYCDLWGKTLFLQIRDINCQSILSYSYPLNKPAQEFKKSEAIKPITETSNIYTDSCGLIRTSVSRNFYTYSFKPVGDWNQLLTVNSGGNRNINYIVTDAHTNYTILQGVTSTLISSAFSYQAEFSFDNPYYHGRTAKIKVYDALNCPIYEDSFTISAQEIITNERPELSITEQNIQNKYCLPSTVDLVLDNTIRFSDHDTVCIIESPGDFSNCTLYFEESQDRWIRCDSNTKVSANGNRNSLTIKDVIVGGYALIRYKHGCFTKDYNHSFYKNSGTLKSVYEAVPATYKVEPTCSGMRITMLSGSYNAYSYGLNNEYLKSRNITYFRVYGNPHSPESVTGIYMVGDVINITLDGDIRIVQTPSQHSLIYFACTEKDTIIHCQKTSLQYDYFYSYCCQIGDTVSSVRTRAKGGVPPYLYVISDKNGNLLDSNRVGDFFNLPLPHHDTVSLKVYDQCGSSFIYQGQIIEQRLLKKVWFDDGTNDKTITDSSFCQFFAIALDNIDYHWVGPDGFSSDKQNPIFFIPADSNMSGKYYLSLQDSACGLIRDSLSLKVLAKSHIPKLIWIADSICSGMDYHQYGFDITSMPSDVERVYYDTLVSPQNDSTFLQLTLLPVYHHPQIDSIITPLDEFHYGTYTLTDTGSYELNFKTNCHCDSTVHVHLMFAKYLPCPDAIDYNGNVYPSIRIQSYCWTNVNLKSKNYSDGRAIEQFYEYVNDEFPDNEENVNIFGRLYDWYAAIDTGAHQLPDSNGNIQGICPEGWLLPTDDDFALLGNYTPRQLRSPYYWLYNSGNNESGFNSLPAGYYDMVRHRYCNLLGNAYYWTCGQPDFPAHIFHLFIDCAILQQSANLCNAYSVRCIKKD